MDESIEDDNGVGQPTPFSSNEGPILPAQPAAEEEEEKQEPPEPEKPKGPLVYQKVGRYSLAWRKKGEHVHKNTISTSSLISYSNLIIRRLK